MDVLKRLGDYLSDRSGAGEAPEVSLESIVMRGEKHLRRQRWLSAAGGAAGMLVFVVIASFAFNTDQAPTDLADNAQPFTEAAAPIRDSDAVEVTTTIAFAEEAAGSGRYVPGIAFTEDLLVTDGTIPGFRMPDLAPSELAAEPLNVDWQSGQAGLTWAQVIESDGLFYALSTAPGVTYEDYDGGHLAQAVYVSSDGLEWTAHELGDGFISDLAISNGTLYSLSTAPGTTESLRIGRSVDSGSSWQYTELPYTASAPEGLGRVQGRNTTSHLAAGPAGVVAMVNTMYYVDYWGVIPLEYHDRTKDRWPEPTAEGIVLRDFTANHEAELACDEAMRADGYPDYDSEEDLPEVCRNLWNEQEQGEIVYSVTWEELGVSANPATDASLYYSSDGVSFERIDSPLGSLGYLTAFEATGNGFVAIEQSHTTGGWTLWSSSDGRTWTNQATLPATGWISAAGATPDGLVIVGDVPSREGGNIAVISTSTDGGQTWRSISPPEDGQVMERYTSAAAVGSFGTIVARTEWSHDETDEFGGRQTTTLYLTNDYQTWNTIDLGGLIEAPGYEVTGLAMSGDRIRFDVQAWSVDGPPDFVSFAGVIGG